jgi:hypothetical protein
MTPSMIQDAQARPKLFFWKGPLDEVRLKEYVDQHGWSVPKDLFDLWLKTGGGEIFESETLLGPWRDPEMGDEVSALNEEFYSRGLPRKYLVFHTGMATSAARLSDGKYVQLDPDSFSEVEVYSSLEDWYRRLLRTEYAERYGLAALDSQ